MYTYINTTLKGVATLCHEYLFTCCLAGECEGVVFRICQVASPQINSAEPQVEAGMSTQHCIKLLAVGVGLVPPDFALCIHVGTNSQTLQERIGKVETIISQHRQCMSRNIRNLQSSVKPETF